VHPRREEFERRVLDGESIRVIAVDTGHSESAANRHLRNHTRPERMAQMRTSLAVHVSDFSDRLLILTDEATEVREYAKRVSDPKLVLQAIVVERDTLGVLLNRLGVESREAAEMLADAKVLARAVTVVLANHRHLATQMAQWLEAEGAGELADALSAYAELPAPHQTQPQPRQLEEIMQ